MAKEPTIRDVKVSDIYERANLSRDVYGRIDLLADAIEENDWVEPLVVLEDKSGKKVRYGMVAGYRRLRAIRLLIERGKWAPDVTVQCQVYTSLTDAAAAALNAAENQQRLEPNYGEFFKTCFELKERYGYTGEQIGKRLNGMSGSHINNCCRAHKQLHPAILGALAKGNKTWPMTRLFDLMSKPKEQQLKLWQAATAVRKVAEEQEQETGEPIVQRPALRRRREIEQAVKDLKRRADASFQIAVETLQWVLGEKSEPW